MIIASIAVFLVGLAIAGLFFYLAKTANPLFATLNCTYYMDSRYGFSFGLAFLIAVSVSISISLRGLKFCSKSINDFLCPLLCPVYCGL
jgi:hypothetical protein